MTRPHPATTILLVLFAAFVGFRLPAQETGEAFDDDDAFFEDPFAVDEPESGDDDSQNDVFADPFTTDKPTEGEADDESESTPDDPFGDLDSLFQDEQMIDTADESQMLVDPQNDLLVREGVTWGGRIRGSLTADWLWSDVWTSDWAFTDPTSESLSPAVGADLSFDARPEAEFRAYGKFRIDTTSDSGIGGFTLNSASLGDGILPEGWTSEENEDGDLEVRDENGVLVATIDGADDEETDAEPTTGTAPGLEISVFELFADYTWKDQVFLRFGKHTIKWGTGYFFSPADVLNLAAVDAEDPTADREGPISLRALYPFGLTGNAYLYAITNADAGVLDIAIAPKVEFVLGPGELGVGAFYQRALAPRLVGLYTASLGEVDVFAEGVLLYGSDRVFVRPSRDQSEATADVEDDLELVLDTYEIDAALFAQATVGARYLKEWDSGPSLVLVGQYFFNGEGYTSEVPGLRPAAARLALNPGENGLSVDNPDDQPEGYTAPPALGFGDLSNWGRHYVGGTVSVSRLLLDELSLSVFGLVNLSDFSGIATPAVSLQFLDRLSLSLSARFTFGPSDGEYTDPASLVLGGDASPTFGLTLGLSMPGGAF